MNGKCFVDTDILIYAHDRSAGAKHLRAQMLLEQLWTSRWGVISTQVIEELCIHLCRNAVNPLPIEEVCLLIRDYSTWEVVPNTPASIQEALDIVLRHNIPFVDALILEAAERSGASILYSEHMSTMTRYGAVQIVNPLIEGPSSVTEIPSKR
ncbi:MAG: PIN domain-containing protein [Terracidiphilus sp.]